MTNLMITVAVTKTVLVDVYTRYTTRLLNEDRTEKRPWEGADRMTELQFESLLACAEGERIEKRVSRPPLVPQPIRHDGAQGMVTEAARRPSMFQTSEDAVDMTGNVGRRPSIFAPDVTHNKISHLCGNNERQPSLFTPDFSMLQPPKNDVMERQTSYFPPESVDNPPEQAMRKPSLGRNSQSLGEPENASAPAQRKPSLLPSLIPMGQASKRIERAERAVMAEQDGQIGALQQKPIKGPVSRLKRPPLLHRSSAPDRVGGELELVGQSTL